MWGHTALIGAYGDADNGIQSGSAYLFRHDGEAWEEVAKLTASDGMPDDLFGRSLAVFGDTALVGAPYDDWPEEAFGSVYVFRGLGTDCNLDGKSDVCDSSGTGDFNGTGDTDLLDYQMMEDCLAGPGGVPDPAIDECFYICHAAFDFDGDHDVDLADMATFQRVLTD